MRPVCVECNGSMSDRHHLARRCTPCNNAYSDAMRAANAVIGREIARGRMTKAKEHLCVDCGSQAFDWDHRDYRKPLEVVPVCRGCNVRRGSAKWRDESVVG
jgi:hypothetical protein